MEQKELVEKAEQQFNKFFSLGIEQAKGAKTGRVQKLLNAGYKKIMKDSFIGGYVCGWNAQYENEKTESEDKCQTHTSAQTAEADKQE